jgi:hypothetical protein
MNDIKLKYRLIEAKYFSRILNLNSNSKEWKRASKALTRLRKTQTYKTLDDNY